MQIQETKKIKSNIHQGFLTNSTLLKNTILIKKNIFTALSKKHFITSDYNISRTNDTIFLQFSGFLQTNKLGRYRKNLKKKKNSTKKKNLLTKLFLNNKPFRNQNLVVETQILNKFISKKKVIKYYISFIKLRSILFSRSRNRFFDFLKIASLFVEKKISLRALLELLGLIFKNLNKKQHNRYIAFIKLFFEIMIKEKVIKGLRLKISGRILGKARANSIVIEKGILALNSMNTETVLEKRHIYTTQGAFGFQMSVNYEKNCE